MKRERLLLFALAAVQFTHIMDFMIMMPLGDMLMKEFSISPQQFSYIVGAYPFLAFFSSISAAFFLDRFDRKKALAFFYIGFLVGTVLCAISPSYLVLMGARGLTGFFGGVLSALVLAIIGDTIPNERRGSAMGTVMAAFSVAAVAGVPFGLFLADKISWHAPFFTVAGLGGLVLLSIFIFVPSITSHMDKTADAPKPNPLQDIIDNLKNWDQVKGLLLMVLLILGQFTIIPFITPYLIRNLGFEQSQIPLVYLLGGGLTIVTSPIIGKLVDRFGRVAVFTALSIISIIPLALLTNLTGGGMPIALLATSLLFIFISGRMIPANTILTSVVPPKRRGSYMSLNSSTRSLATGLATVISGWVVIETGEEGPLMNYNIVGYLAIGFSLIAILLGRSVKNAEKDAT